MAQETHFEEDVRLLSGWKLKPLQRKCTFENNSPFFGKKMTNVDSLS
jgi:hypothetical protein